MPGGRCRWAPLGVVGMIGTWNYPLFLNAPPIAQALAAGNAVVWKASELAPLCGAKLEQSLKEAGFPEGLVAVVQGGPEVGRGLVESDRTRGCSPAASRTAGGCWPTLGRRGIPAVAELSGFDPAIVLDDAPMESTVRALTWAAFVGCGQTCVAVKRVYVVGDPAPWAEALAAAARALRVGDPASPGVDVGPMISAGARERFHADGTCRDRGGSGRSAGGEPLDGPGHFYPPTVFSRQSPEPEAPWAGAFGPVVIVRGVADPQAAVDAAMSPAPVSWASVPARMGTLARYMTVTLARAAP